MISFVLGCLVFAAACVGVERYDLHRRQRVQGGTWGDSGIRRHRDTGEYRRVPLSVPVAVDEPVTAALRVRGIRQTRMSHDAIRDMPYATPRRYVGRAEVAALVIQDVAGYLRGAAEWQSAMRELVA